MRKCTMLKVLAAGIIFAMSALSMSGSITYAADDSDTVITNDENGIPDKVLYDAVLAEGDTNRDGVLTKGEAEGITSLKCSDKGIRSIQGIQFLINLNELELTRNAISDISALSGMNNLIELNMSNNVISDISGLVGLNNLVRLYLSSNQISDISGLGNLNNLMMKRV